MNKDNKLFQAAKEKVINHNREKNGIGTLSEKTLHAILKNYYEPDASKHEISIDRYVADIFNGREIIEIQTAQFNRVKEKIGTFLPLYPVTIVYPIAREKWLYWIDPETGEIAEKRKSPKKGNEYMGFAELYKIKKYLKEPNLRIIFLLLDVEEYKLLDGWGSHKKNHASKYDRIPLNIYKEIVIEKKEDYMQFVPCELEDGFTSATFAKVARIPRNLATVVLNILHDMEVVERAGQEGRSYLYKIKAY